ncbi:MAG: hypothetical protein ABGW69_00700 [Nanoarchaeota archaeon]
MKMSENNYKRKKIVSIKLDYDIYELIKQSNYSMSKLINNLLRDFFEKSSNNYFLGLKSGSADPTFAGSNPAPCLVGNNLKNLGTN